MPKTIKTEIELLRLLHEFIKQTGVCAGVVITRVIDEDAGDWRFDIPTGINAACRGAIIRAQATLRRQYDLATID